GALTFLLGQNDDVKYVRYLLVLIDKRSHTNAQQTGARFLRVRANEVSDSFVSC
ncbi:hypothetical protein DFR28_1205, partial [Arenicella xantha]